MLALTKEELKFLWNFKRTLENIIDFKKKKMLAWTKEELKPKQDGKVCYICGKRI